MSLKTCVTAYGKMCFYGKDEYIGRSLYNYGEWSGDECDKLLSLANGLFVDVGANVGYFSLALSSKVPVVAFEPQPELYKLLVRNTGLGHNVALSSVSGTAVMPKIRYGDRGNYGGLGLGYRSELGTITVETRTLDSYNLDVGLLKIDVEGHELEVLKGGVETISRCSPIMYIEDDRDDKRDQLRKFIKYLGYNIEEHNTSIYRENNYFGLKKNIWDRNYISKNIICWK